MSPSTSMARSDFSEPSQSTWRKSPAPASGMSVKPASARRSSNSSSTARRASKSSDPTLSVSPRGTAANVSHDSGNDADPPRAVVAGRRVSEHGELRAAAGGRLGGASGRAGRLAGRADELGALGRCDRGLTDRVGGGGGGRRRGRGGGG